MTDTSGIHSRSDRARQDFGSHREFADLYEKFLDAVYDSPSEQAPGNGRWLLIRQVANEIRNRGAREVLDCAAGTGFPALNLQAIAGDYGINTLHYTDGDPEMIRVLRRRAGDMALEAPPRTRPKTPTGSTKPNDDPLVFKWAELNQIRRTYDYVLCRGNSLAYADTWTGDQTVATSCKTIVDYLKQIAAKVKIGGHIHIDAPWKAELQQRCYRPVASGAVKIWEEVETGPDYRHWRVSFKLPSGEVIKFERYSSRLTIREVAVALDDMGFVETEPFSMAGERPNFGVIVARRTR